MKRIIMYLEKYKKECVFAPLFKMLEALFELFVPLVISAIIDKGIAGKDTNYVIKMCLLLLLLAIIGLVCSITAQYFAAKAAVGCATSMRHSLFSHIQNLSFSDMDKVGTSTLITRMTSDINQVQNGVNLVLRLFLRSPFIVFGAMIMAFTIDTQSALIFVAAIPVLSLIVFGIMLITNPMYKKVQGGLDKILLITRENLVGSRVIRAFNKENDEINRFQKSNEELNTMQKYVGKISALMNPLTYVVVNLAIIAIISVGAGKVNNGVLTQGQVVALYNYMAQILVELIKLANLIVSITKALACANRIDSVFAIKSSMIDGNSTCPDASENVPAVEFKNVGIKYNSAAQDAVSNISFIANKGETIGIIGGTGSGKSTVVSLIPRFYDATEGEVLINGKNVKDCTVSSLREKIGVVMQKTVLFKGSIKDNLLIANQDADLSNICTALEVSQSMEFVKQKSGDINSFVEQGGKNLSGGQRQRLNIARALVRNPEILILDDSASALDFATDARLRKAIRTLKNAPTVFIVSQRAASLMGCDKILVLDDGNIAGEGTHTELLENCEVYKEIYYSQFKKEGE